MLKAVRLLSPFMLIFLLIGCSTDSDYGVMSPNTSEEPLGILMSPKTTIPDASALTLARLYLYVDIDSDQRIDVHRVTAAWEENSVTWNSFGGAYNGDIGGSFMADGMGWRWVNITSLVQAWMDGTQANHGLLLDQISAEAPRTQFQSRESYYPPYLELCFDGSAGCEQIAPLGDVTIRGAHPDENWNHMDQLWTGGATDVDPTMQSLIIFDIPVLPGGGTSGCTHTSRYWQRHSGCWRGRPDLVTPLLPLWLGAEDGRKSIEVDTKREARVLLWMGRCWGRWNGIQWLYGELLAAKLNVANGADPSEIAAVMAQADMFLKDNNYRSWRRLSRGDRKMVRGWAKRLTCYNKGRIGPGSCD